MKLVIIATLILAKAGAASQLVGDLRVFTATRITTAARVCAAEERA